MGSLAQNLKTCMGCRHVGWRQAPCAGACPCTVDGRDIRAHAQDNDCPKGFYVEGVPDPPVPRAQRVAEEGRRRWDAYHRRALAWDGTNIEAEREYRAGLAKGMAGCACAEHWGEHVAEHPLTAATTAEYFALTVADHNAVNKRLGKPPLTFADAAAIY